LILKQIQKEKKKKKKMLLSLIESFAFFAFFAFSNALHFYSHLDNHTAVSVFDDIPKSK